MKRALWVCLCWIIMLGHNAWGQIDIQGPGLPPGPPLRVNVNPPGGPTTVIYTFENKDTAPQTITPSIQCPPDTVDTALIDVAIEIPAAQIRSIQARFNDLTDGAAADETVECLLITDQEQTPLFVQLVEPPSPPPLGSLDLKATLRPEGKQSESVKFTADVESNLRLNVTLSGLSAGVDLGFGVTGAEFGVLNLKGFLGGVDLDDQFVFAAPFDFKKRVLLGGRVSFVKKRVRTRLNLLGLLIDNLAIFENTKFKQPFVNEAEALEAVQSPSFRFGDLLTLVGRTAPGIPIRMVFGLCADPSRPNVIKKRVFSTSVCDADTLPFIVSQMRLGPIDWGGIQVSSSLELRPDKPLRQTLSANTTLLDLFRVALGGSWDGRTFTPRSTRISLSSPLLFLSVSLDKQFQLSSASANVTLKLDPARLSLRLGANATSLRSASLTFSTPVLKGRFNASLRFLRSADTLSFNGARLRFRQPLDHLTVSASVSLAATGLSQIQWNAQWVF